MSVILDARDLEDQDLATQQAVKLRDAGARVSFGGRCSSLGPHQSCLPYTRLSRCARFDGLPFCHRFFWGRFRLVHGGRRTTPCMCCRTTANVESKFPSDFGSIRHRENDMAKQGQAKPRRDVEFFTYVVSLYGQSQNLVHYLDDACRYQVLQENALGLAVCSPLRHVTVVGCFLR